jgi:hypothetical protein
MSYKLLIHALTRLYSCAGPGKSSEYSIAGNENLPLSCRVSFPFKFPAILIIIKLFHSFPQLAHVCRRLRFIRICTSQNMKRNLSDSLRPLPFCHNISTFLFIYYFFFFLYSFFPFYIVNVVVLALRAPDALFALHCFFRPHIR